jgi:hypothetical protein
MKQATTDGIKSFISKQDFDYFKLKEMDWNYLKETAPILVKEFNISFQEAVVHLANYPLPKPEVTIKHVNETLRLMQPKKKYYVCEDIKLEKP